MIKQVILARKDLEMPAGKLAAQVAHASGAWLSHRVFDAYDRNRKVKLSIAEAFWMGGEFTKIVLQVPTEADLLHLYKEAHEMGLESHLITDSGHTVFDGIPTNTCVAIGPDYADKIDPLTKDLRLY